MVVWEIRGGAMVPAGWSLRRPIVVAFLVSLASAACVDDDVRSPDLSDPDSSEPDAGTLTVSIAPVRSIRDLVATTNASTATIRWQRNGASTPVVGPVAPARLLTPGDVWTAVATFGDESVSATYTVPAPPGGNVLILLLDDIGVDHVGAYDIGSAPPPTPRMDALAAQGVRFDNAYAAPVCSPTRGVLLTGRHARRTGLGWIADTGARTFGLPLAATTIAEALDYARGDRWSSSAVGKWHVAAPQFPSVLTHPNDQGFDWFAGTVGNPKYADGYGYYRWDRNLNGVITESFTYLTTASVDDALERAAVMPEPWLLYVGFHAAHTPLAPPPPHLTTLVVDEDSGRNALFDATVEALDTEIGRLLDSMDPGVLARTTVILVGDNGTAAHAVDPPLDPEQAKHTIYEGGVRVPLIIAGPHVDVPGGVSDALVYVSDVFATTAEIAGVPLGGPDASLSLDVAPPVVLDGRSLLPQLADPLAPGHSVLYVEAFAPNGDHAERSIDRRMVRDERYKLLRNGSPANSPASSFHDLWAGNPLDDGPNLLDRQLSTAEQASFARLSAALDFYEATLSFEGK